MACCINFLASNLGFFGMFDNCYVRVLMMREQMTTFPVAVIIVMVIIVMVIIVMAFIVNENGTAMNEVKH
jgi:hypothetical protein